MKPKMPEFIKKAFLEDDGKTVSSSRLMGGLTFAVLHFCNVTLVGAISWGIWSVIKIHPIDNMALTSLLGSIKYLALLYLILAATALALYGINIWKYVSAIKNGLNNDVDGLEEEVTKTSTQVESTKTVTTPTKAPEVQVEKPTKDDL
jgi:hypothetical protein